MSRQTSPSYRQLSSMCELLGPEQPPVSNEVYRRKCLRCDVAFEVNNPYRRLCDQCRKTVNYLDIPFIIGW